MLWLFISQKDNKLVPFKVTDYNGYLSRQTLLEVFTIGLQIIMQLKGPLPAQRSDSSRQLQNHFTRWIDITLLYTYFLHFIQCNNI